MRKRICFCTTISGSIKSFLVDLSNYLVSKENYDVTFICDTDDSLYEYCNEHIHYFPVKMKRGIGLDGIKATWKMYRYFRKEKFDIVQYATPNASLYASIASRFAGIPCRIYCQWGVRYIEFKGLARSLYRALVKIMCNNATAIEVESHSIYDFSLGDGLYDEKKASVIWNGSACGVNLDKYDLSKKAEWRREYRKKYGIPNDVTVFGYCGRITRDKGLNELFAAFRELVDVQKRDARLMLIGRNDNVETIDPDLFAWAQSSDKVVFTGYTKDVSQHYAALDVFCSLSYREGFGLVVIEAAAMSVPGIVTDCPGQRDTIEDHVTGLSVPGHNVDKVVDAMNCCIDDPSLVIEMGANARSAVENKYEQKELFRLLAAHRNELIENGR